MHFIAVRAQHSRRSFVFAEQQPLPPPSFYAPAQFGTPSHCTPHWMADSLGQWSPRNIDPEICRRMSMSVLPSTPPALAILDIHPMGPLTSLSSRANYTPPWTNHNIFAGQQKSYPTSLSKSGPFDRRTSIPTGSNSIQLGRRRSQSSVQAAAPNHAKQRVWSIHLENSEQGELVPVGIRSSDGDFIHHGMSGCQALLTRRSRTAYQASSASRPRLRQRLGLSRLLECFRQGESYVEVWRG
jgi:hypothetical protein